MEQKLVVSLPEKCVEEKDVQPEESTSILDTSYFEAYTTTTISPTWADTEQSCQDDTSSSHDNTASAVAVVTPAKVTQPEVSLAKIYSVEEVHLTPACEDEDEMFECGICTEYLEVPKSLPCLHNFCLDCLSKYLRANNMKEGDNFKCPTCRAEVAVPSGGPVSFPTNFHVVNLRKRCRDLDMGLTIREAVCYLESRAEEIVEELGERKRQALIAISERREELGNMLEDIMIASQASVEEHYSADSTRCVEYITSIKTKLSELQLQLGNTPSDAGKSSETSANNETIKLNALTKLRRQAEIISNVNNELEELKTEADRQLSNTLDHQVAFLPGASSRESLQKTFGKLLLVHDKDSLQEVMVRTQAADSDREGFSPLHVQSWSQSWWVLVFAVLPAIAFALGAKVLMRLVEKLLD